jgi:hypothetical protein
MNSIGQVLIILTSPEIFGHSKLTGICDPEIFGSKQTGNCDVASISSCTGTWLAEQEIKIVFGPIRMILSFSSLPLTFERDDNLIVTFVTSLLLLVFIIDLCLLHVYE